MTLHDLVNDPGELGTWPTPRIRSDPAVVERMLGVTRHDRTARRDVAVERGVQTMRIDVR